MSNRSAVTKSRHADCRANHWNAPRTHRHAYSRSVWLEAREKGSEVGEGKKKREREREKGDMQRKKRSTCTLPFKVRGAA